jgi:ubiquinone/menaquinone biosynthesis C-methylase UbiE
MSDLKEIYNSQATRYHDLISHEDVDSNLLPAIEKVSSLKEKRLLDIETGTGRIPLLVQHLTSNIVGIDLYWDMLQEHKSQKSHKKMANKAWDLLQADYRFLPFTDRNFDIITAGWSISALREWENQDWENQIGFVMREIHRAIKPGGAIIILETMSSASMRPAPPNENLAEYYLWLKNVWGFVPHIIQTDYQFNNFDQAVETIGIFFGTDLANKVRDNHWIRVPEWTGIWSKTVPISK